MKTSAIAFILCALLAACSDSSQAPAATTETENEATSGSEYAASGERHEATPASTSPTDPDLVAQKPDAEKLQKHLGDHIQYPATKAEIVAACAQTNEFTPAEQKWISESLPDGTYNSNDDVAKGLNLTSSPE